MPVTEMELERAAARTRKECDAGHALSARHDRRRRRVVVRLNTGIEIAFPVALAEGLAGGSSEDLAEIEVSPTGLGLHWPRLDADLYVPALLRACSAPGAGWPRKWVRRAASPDRPPRPRPRGKTAARAGGCGVKQVREVPARAGSG